MSKPSPGIHMTINAHTLRDGDYGLLVVLGIEGCSYAEAT